MSHTISDFTISERKLNVYFINNNSNHCHGSLPAHSACGKKEFICSLGDLIKIIPESNIISFAQNEILKKRSNIFGQISHIDIKFQLTDKFFDILCKIIKNEAVLLYNKDHKRNFPRISPETFDQLNSFYNLSIDSSLYIINSLHRSGEYYKLVLPLKITLQM